MTRAAPLPTISEPAAGEDACIARVVIENKEGRAAFIAAAAKHLPEGEVLVQVKDLHGRRRAFRTTPTHPRAQLVATEAPLVLRGGLTALVSYWRVPADALDAIETHYENGHESHSYEVELRVAARGRRVKASIPA